MWPVPPKTLQDVLDNGEQYMRLGSERTTYNPYLLLRRAAWLWRIAACRQL